MNLILRNTTYASRNTVQSKLNDYAKQTQFPKSRNGYNLSKYKELQRTMNCELLLKQTQSNPISKGSLTQSGQAGAK
jgi:hypothetical protein